MARLSDALAELPPDARQNVQVVYIAHSIPISMADTCDYVRQLEEVRKLVSAKLGISNDALVYQSRSGAPGQPWLEPDILDYIREVKTRNQASAVVLAPISFISDHMEVLYDLDIEARQLCDSLQLPMARAKTVGVHPAFIGMIREFDSGTAESGHRTPCSGIAGSTAGCVRGRLLSGASASGAATAYRREAGRSVRRVSI